MHCHNCGHYSLKGAVFCSKCGERLNESKSLTQQHLPSQLQSSSKIEDKQDSNTLNNSNDFSTIIYSNTNNADRFFTTFVGQKYYHFYRHKWFKKHSPTLNPNSKNINIVSFNLAALIFGNYWLFYRKMYLEGIIFTISLGLFDIGLAYVLGIEKYVSIISIIYILPFLIFLSIFGNYLYLKFATRQILRIRTTSSDAVVIERKLGENGGTSWLILFFGILFEYLIYFIMDYYLAPGWYLD